MGSTTHVHSVDKASRCVHTGDMNTQTSPTVAAREASIARKVRNTRRPSNPDPVQVPCPEDELFAMRIIDRKTGDAQEHVGDIEHLRWQLSLISERAASRMVFHRLDASPWGPRVKVAGEMVQRYVAAFTPCCPERWEA